MDKSKVVNIAAKGKDIYLFLRDGEDLRIEKDEEFCPYFYVEDEDGKYNSLFGEKLQRIELKHPGDVKRERNNYPKTWEADILYTNRYLIDKVDKIEKTKLRVHYIDIETLSGKNGKMEPASRAGSPVVSITVYDNFLDMYVTFVWHESFTESKAYKKEDDWLIMECITEEEMRDSFIAFENKYPCDIWEAWNGEGFDYPYLFNRYEDKINDVSLIGEAGFDGYNYHISGISLLDMYVQYKKINSRQRESYTLNYIGNYELGYGKEDIGGIDETWKDDPIKLASYNKQDVKIMVELDKKLHIVDYYDGVRRVAKCTFHDVTFNSRVVDMLLLGFCNGKWVLPSKNRVEKEKFGGGEVLKPVPGLHDWVAMLDATALYPSIIRSFNLSPETVSDDGDIEIDGVRFRSDIVGILPQAAKMLMDKRQGMKQQMSKLDPKSDEYNILDKQQFTFKGFVNSLFGYTAFRGSRLFCIDVAKSITYIGRELLKASEVIIKDDGYRILYGDTDGLYIQIVADDLKDMIQKGGEIQKKVNSSIGPWVEQFGIHEHCMGFKFEMVYRRIFLGVKKRHAGLLVWREGLDVDNKIDIKGYEVKRSDTPKPVRDMQKELFRRVLTGEDERETQQFLDGSIKEMLSIKNGLGFPISITKKLNDYSGNPIHVRASRYSNKHFDMDIGNGDKIKYYFVKNGLGKKDTDVVAIKEGYEHVLDGFNVDLGRTKERILKKINPILEGVGYVQKQKINYRSLV